MHFGYPFMHGQDIRDPEFGEGADLSKFTKPAIDLGPHVAALGMTFYTGEMFPEEYKNQIFIAEHGSWNRSKKIGYRVMLVKLEGNEAVSYEPFAEGWLQGDSVSGRPVDVLVMPDGSMLVSDDYGGMIYRITYSN
jgi:glucose/arabinose dehydrogenase